jgi:hypothetical protein
MVRLAKREEAQDSNESNERGKERREAMYSDDKLEVGNLTVRLEQDQDAESPRDWDNLGRMVCWHRNYSLGDKHEFSTPQDFLESDDYKNAAIVLPLGLYDHSGITMYVGSEPSPFDPGGWDSGQVGYIYVTKEAIRKEYSCKRISKATLAKVEGVLRQEVKTFDDFITGNVWGFIVETEDGETVDSCWGFIGDVDYAFSEGKAAAKAYLESEREAEQSMRDTFAL